MSYLHQSLLSDGSLVLSIDDSLRDMAMQWMPRLPSERDESHAANASIRVDREHLSRADQPATHILSLGRVRAWMSESRDSVWLENNACTIVASVDLSRRDARVSVRSSEQETNDMTSMLTIVAALLLVRDGRTPVHAGGVIDPATGSAWLLVGDSHSGKSTTTANLVRAGWSYLSDDYVVMLESNDEIVVEGWPDDFHLDEGWSRGESTGVRAVFSEVDVAEGMRLQAAPLGGFLFPRVEADSDTALLPVSAGVALERLIRQSPWLVADEASAAKVFELLANAALFPAADLRLGLDTFANPALLAQRVSAATASMREPAAQ